MYKRAVTSLLLLLIGGFIGWFIASRAALEQFQDQLFNSTALEFGRDFDVISILQREGTYSEEVRAQYEKIFLMRLIPLSVLGPASPSLRADVAESTCRLLQYRNRHILEYAGLEPAISRVNTYLDSLEPYIMSWIREMQETAGGTDCHIGVRGGNALSKSNQIAESPSG